MKTKVITVLSLTLSLFLIFSCAGTFEVRAYKSMLVMSTAYDTALRAAANEYQKGMISEEGKEKIIGYAEKYRTAHNEAVAAFLEYENASPEEKATKEAQARVLTRALFAAYNSLVDVFIEYGVDSDKVEPWF